MTYKGIYRDGVVILRGQVDLPEGAPVEVNPVRRRRAAAPARTASGRAAAAQRRAKQGGGRKRSRGPARSDPFLKAFGIWKDRPEWKGMTTLQIVKELRRKALGNRARP